MNIRWMLKKDGEKPITGMVGFHHERDDEDDPHAHHHDYKSTNGTDPHKKKECPGMIRAKYVLDHHPATWEQYEDASDGPIRIVEMEIGELKAACASYKAGTGTIDAVLHELGDVAAASIRAYTLIINKQQK